MSIAEEPHPFDFVQFNCKIARNPVKMVKFFRESFYKNNRSGITASFQKMRFAQSEKLLDEYTMIIIYHKNGRLKIISP